MPQNSTQTQAFQHPAVDLAGAWLLHSGIQEPCGGVARYYLADAHRNRAISTEITGYAVSVLLYLYEGTNDECYLDAAARAGRFLTSLAWNPELELFPFEHAAGQEPVQPQPRGYFFDSGIIVRGLLRLWQVTKEGELLEIARACGRSMRSVFAAGDSEYHPILELPGKQPEPRSDRWSRAPGCYQLKAGLAWLDLYRITGDADFLAWYEDLLAASLRTQESFLPGAAGDGVMDRLHAYCYFLEGIQPRVNRPEVAAALAGGIARVVSYLSRLEPGFVRSDVCSQLLRVQLLADRAGIAALDRQAAAATAAAIEAFQIRHGDPRLHGGFFFARRDGKPQPHVNPVSTAFGVQAIVMWRQYLAGELPFSPDSVI